MKSDLSPDFHEGDIHIRDHLQFELKSEFVIHPQVKYNTYKQEVYLFIPSTLQINSKTYSKDQFYHDQTTLIRYRTPPFTLEQLIDTSYSLSPLNVIEKSLKPPVSVNFLAVLTDETKLFAAIFRASLRNSIFQVIKNFQIGSTTIEVSALKDEIISILNNTSEILSKYRALALQASLHMALDRHLQYIDEAISTTVEGYFLILLKHLRSSSLHDIQLDQNLCNMILEEQNYRKTHLHDSSSSHDSIIKKNEALLYRQGILNRFVLESLKLKNYRVSLEEQHSNLLGATAAGIAMFIYMGLLVWKSSSFVINSFPFVTLAVVLYILKDRIKEGLKTLYHKQISPFFPDYATVIKNPKGHQVGKLLENFNFIGYKQLSHLFQSIRHRDFHDELHSLHRHESIMQYKREVILYPPIESSGTGRRKELTTIFRFNIHHFIEKASNAFEETLHLNPETNKVEEILLPKIYHLNIIIQNTFLETHSSLKTEIKAFRIILNKNGIKRVEHIPIKSFHEFT